MNERIKELAKQSGAWDYYEINEGVDGDEKPLKDFAELIVRKAMDYASRNWEHGHLLAEDLRVYFGVE